MQPLKAALKADMIRAGLVAPYPTRILLARSGVALTEPGSSDAPDRMGDTSWKVDAQGRVVGYVTIRIAGGLPRHLFRHVLAHEYAHAALVGGPNPEAVSLATLEGFAESVAVAYLANFAETTPERSLVERIIQNQDPIYGGGVRAMMPVVQRLGIERVAALLRAGSPAWTDPWQVR